MRKHGVAFELAREVFDDPNALDEPDDDPDEKRFKITGRTALGSRIVLVVIYTERGQRIRIISAREAEPYEQNLYDRQTRP